MENTAKIITFEYFLDFIKNPNNIKDLYNNENFDFYDREITKEDMIEHIDGYLTDLVKEGRYFNAAYNFYKVFIKNKGLDKYKYNLTNALLKSDNEELGFAKHLLEDDTLDQDYINSISDPKVKAKVIKNYLEVKGYFSLAFFEKLDLETKKELYKYDVINELVSFDKIFNNISISNIKNLQSLFVTDKYIQYYNNIDFKNLNQQDEKFLTYMMKLDFEYKKQMFESNIRIDKRMALFKNLSTEEKTKIILDENSYIYNFYDEDYLFMLNAMTSFSDLLVSVALQNKEHENIANIENLALIVLKKAGKDTSVFDSNVKNSINRIMINGSVKKVSNVNEDSYDNYEQELNNHTLYDVVLLLKNSNLTEEDKKSLVSKKIKLANINPDFNKFLMNNAYKVFEDYINGDIKNKLEKIKTNDFDSYIINSYPMLKKGGFDVSIIEKKIDTIFKAYFEQKNSMLSQSLVNEHSLHILFETFVKKYALSKGVNCDVNIRNIKKRNVNNIRGIFNGYINEIALNENFLKKNMKLNQEMVSVAFHEVKHAVQFKDVEKQEVNETTLKRVKDIIFNHYYKNSTFNLKKEESFNFKYNASELDADRHAINETKEFLNSKDVSFKKGEGVEKIKPEEDYRAYDGKIREINVYMDTLPNELLVSLMKQFPVLKVEYKSDGTEKSLRELFYQYYRSNDPMYEKIINNKISIGLLDDTFGLDVEYNYLKKIDNLISLIGNAKDVEFELLEPFLATALQSYFTYEGNVNLSEEAKKRSEVKLNYLSDILSMNYNIDIYDLNLPDNPSRAM